MESRTNLHPPCIIVHGGAWAIPESLKEPSINGVKRAAKTGYDRLIEVLKITNVEPYFEHCGYVPNELQLTNLVELKKKCVPVVHVSLFHSVVIAWHTVYATSFCWADGLCWSDGKVKFTLIEAVHDIG